MREEKTGKACILPTYNCAHSPLARDLAHCLRGGTTLGHAAETLAEVGTAREMGKEQQGGPLLSCSLAICPLAVRYEKWQGGEGERGGGQTIRDGGLRIWPPEKVG